MFESVFDTKYFHNCIKRDKIPKSPQKLEPPIKADDFITIPSQNSPSPEKQRFKAKPLGDFRL